MILDRNNYYELMTKLFEALINNAPRGIRSSSRRDLKCGDEA